MRQLFLLCAGYGPRCHLKSDRDQPCQLRPDGVGLVGPDGRGVGPVQGPSCVDDPMPGLNLTTVPVRGPGSTEDPVQGCSAVSDPLPSCTSVIREQIERVNREEAGVNMEQAEHVNIEQTGVNRDQMEHVNIEQTERVNIEQSEHVNIEQAGVNIEQTEHVNTEQAGVNIEQTEHVNTEQAGVNIDQTGHVNTEQAGVNIEQTEHIEQAGVNIDQTGHVNVDQTGANRDQTERVSLERAEHVLAAVPQGESLRDAANLALQNLITQYSDTQGANECLPHATGFELDTETDYLFDAALSTCEATRKPKQTGKPAGCVTRALGSLGVITSPHCSQLIDILVDILPAWRHLHRLALYSACKYPCNSHVS